MEKITIEDIAKGGVAFLNGTIDAERYDFLLTHYMSQDDTAIPKILEILEISRQRDKKLLIETNFQLSRAYSGLNDFASQTKKDRDMREFMLEKIREHYKSWKNFIRPTIVIKELDDE